MKKIYGCVLSTLTFLPLTAQKHLRFKQENNPLKTEHLVSDPTALTLVADDTAHFLKKVPKSKYAKADNGFFDHHGITIQDVQDTAAFIAEVGAKRPKLLKTAWFFNEFFDFYRWYSDDCFEKISNVPRGWGKPPEFIRTTTYRACKVHGSKVKTQKYTCPLYAVPLDEKNKTPDAIKAHTEKFLRFKYTKTEILKGSLEDNPLIKPLAWVDAADYKEFVMQGTVKVVYEDKSEQIIRVAGTNGKASPEKYWFASPVVYRDPRQSSYPLKVEPTPEVSFAGNIKELGFGKVIALRGWNKETRRLETRIGLLVDTGTAFENNLCQLDIFTGYFDSKEEYHQKIKGYPHTAQAYVLIKKKNRTFKL